MRYTNFLTRGFGALTVILAVHVSAQVTPAIHDPWLNWDVYNRTGQPVNDIHVIVENSTFSPNHTDPNQVYMGPFQTFQSSPAPGGGTLLSWSNPVGGPIPTGGVAHIGLYMGNSGRIIDSYWTQNGTPFGYKIPIIYELTSVQPNQTNTSLGDISMLLGTTEHAENQLGVGQNWKMVNVRTWMNIPAADMGLVDIGPGLDLNADPRLVGRETVPNPGSFVVDSFFDVFTEVELGTTSNLGPGFRSLLYGDVRLTNDINDPGITYLQFWNLNPQSPEPGTTVMLAIVAGFGIMRRRR